MNTELVTKEQPKLIIHNEPNPLAGTPSYMLQLAIEHGADLDKLERLMDLKDRHDAAQAKRLYDEAFAAFKAEAVSILKGKKVTDGPLKGKSYAELHDVVSAVTPALSKHGLSSFWRLTKDEPGWMEVTCYMRHIGGHEESVSMGGPPDTGGAKNVIQARGSTKTYLERYTLKAITGLSEREDDNDGNKTDQLVSAVQKKMLEAVLAKCSKTAQENFAKMHGSAAEITKAEFDEVMAKLENSVKRAAQGDQK